MSVLHIFTRKDVTPLLHAKNFTNTLERDTNMSFNIEKALLELAQTNAVTKNIAGHQFQLMTLTDSIRDELEHEDNLESLLDKAANFGLSIKQERAVEFNGMTEQKLELFWSRKDFATEDEETSVRHQFGQAVLAESDMEDMIEAFVDDDEVSADDIDVTMLENDANSHNPVI